MLKVFQDINMVMERTGEFGPAGAAGGGKEDLLKMVAKNNVMRTGILSSKIGLTKRFEAAWKDPECDRIYEHLRKEMEIDRRYDDLEVKVSMLGSCCQPSRDAAWCCTWRIYQSFSNKFS